MSFDMILVFAILAATILLFISDRIRLDLVALLAMLALMLTNILSPAEALAGFSNAIVLIIAGLFVVGTALFQTGVANAMGIWLTRLAGNNSVGLLVAVMLVVAPISAFMSNTGATAVLLPVVFSMAWNAGLSPAKLLIPLAFGSSIGGMLTLIGTPPNIVVSNQLAAAGYDAFGFFAFSSMGLLVLIVGLLFMVLIGRFILPDRRVDATDYIGEAGTDAPTIHDLARAYGVDHEFYRLRVRRNSPLVGRPLGETHLRHRYHVTVLAVQHWPDALSLPSSPIPADTNTVIDMHDILHVQGNAEDVARLAREESLGVRSQVENGDNLLARELGLAEALLTPASQLIGRTLVEVRFEEVYGLSVLGIKRMGNAIQGPLGHVEIRFGDTLLLEGPWEKIAQLRKERRNLVVVGQPKEMAEMLLATDRAPAAVLIMVGMLVLMTTGIVPTVVAVILAAVAVVLTGCLSMEDVYRTMSWESLVLIAAMLPMATALEKTGGVQYIADGLIATLGGWGPYAVMAGLFVITTLFSQFISNTATTVLVAPIALQAAMGVGVSPHAFLMAVAVAASAAFSTPIASPVNTLVLGPGGYRFSDFVKVGLPLQILIMVLAMAALPLFFPF